MTTSEPAAATLTCPKCAGPMRTYERNGITIDQCTECRGIFLDRGELERLVEAEDVHYGGVAGSSAPAPAPAPDDRYADPGYRNRGYDDRGYGDPGYGGGKHGGGGGKHGGSGRGDPRRRRGGFLGDLLDFG